MAKDGASWRQPCSSLNYIETSTWTRQEHNGFSHQNPGFIGTVLSLPTQLARVYFPSVLLRPYMSLYKKFQLTPEYSADANTAASVIAHCLKSRNYVSRDAERPRESLLTFIPIGQLDRGNKGSRTFLASQTRTCEPKLMPHSVAVAGPAHRRGSRRALHCGRLYLGVLLDRQGCRPRRRSRRHRLRAHP